MSPVRSAKLVEVQRMLNTDSRKLAKACKTRWRSHDGAVTAAMSKMTAVWAALQHFASQKNDATAIGILKLTRTKSFIMCLHLLAPAITRLKNMSLIFQTGDLNFAHVTSSLRECTDAIEADGREVCDSLREQWPSYIPSLGEFNEEDANQANELAAMYCSNMLDNLAVRFPEPDMLAPFRNFDPHLVPCDLPRALVPSFRRMQLRHEDCLRV